jgi:hypothetical protein
VAGNAMTPTPDGNEHTARTGKVHGGNHICNPSTPHNAGGPSIDHAIPNTTCDVIFGIIW